MNIDRLRLLLIEDDEDDHILTKNLLSDISEGRFEIQWITEFDAGLHAIRKNDYDLCLLDYRLGRHDGLEFLRRARDAGCETPIILLAGQGDLEIDIEAMRAGAADYLVKGEINALSLERSIR
ncbi:MAG: response regulator, partial [Acidobacteria bacterium]|nr:response regulator [Acidobacteriota bacterium]